MNFLKKTGRGKASAGTPNSIDVHVGNRIKLRRTLLGFTQEKLAALLGLTFQQVQKYERGLNRVGASRLWDISRVLDVPVNFFYDDMGNEVASKSPRTFLLSESKPALLREESEEFSADPMSRRETLELVKAYYKIKDRQAAKQMFDLIVTMSHASPAAFAPIAPALGTKGKPGRKKATA